MSEALKLAEEWKDRADDCGRLARALLASSHVATSLSDMLQKSYDQGCKDMAMPLTDDEVGEAYGLFTNLMQSGRDRKEVIRILIERSIEARASQPGRDGKAELGSPSRPVASALSATGTRTCQHFPLTETAAKNLRDWINDGDGGVQEVTLHVDGDGALSVSITEYPEEGAMPLYEPIKATDGEAKR